jgi:hypothetical protein
MAMEGYIKVYRSMLKWEWYTKPVTRSLFQHCLLKANYQESRWKGIIIPAGSFVTSEQTLCQELTFSRREIRTALTHLKSTNDITIKTASNYTMINVVNWAKYQGCETDIGQPNDQQLGHQEANDRPTIGQRQATVKEIKELKKERIKEEVLLKDTETGVSSVRVSTPKSRYGEFRHVLLTEKQFNKLHDDFPNADELITFLDEYIQMKGYKANDHNLAIRKWVVTAVSEEKLKKRIAQPVKETFQEEVDRRVKAVQKIMGVEQE